MTGKYMIIGLCGATNSGKTTTLRRLCQYFQGAKTMCQDHYFLMPGDKRLEYIPELNHENWETLSALDMDSMVKDVHKWIDQQQSRGDNSTSLLFIEGFLIFNHMQLARLFDKKYFLTIDRKTCEERRRKREYEPPDPPGYFEKIVWPMYVKNKEELKEQTNICYLNGALDQAEIVKKIQEDILKSL